MAMGQAKFSTQFKQSFEIHSAVASIAADTPAGSVVSLGAVVSRLRSEHLDNDLPDEALELAVLQAAHDSGWAMRLDAGGATTTRLVL
jgi:hypothetical protein